ncbi:hypothetical protein SUGI_0673610 [Cryptomeria japonica]|nr:hypothetical protein SUGI_0673610 [Cryptomeria japonica]
MHRITVDGCWELEELSCAHLSCLENITINGCWMLRNITGYERLDQLKYLQLSAIYNGGIILNCIKKIQRLPSESTIISGHAVDGAESILNTNLFFSQIDADAVNEIDRNELGVFESVFLHSPLTCLLKFLSKPLNAQVQRENRKILIAEITSLESKKITSLCFVAGMF